MMQVVASKCNRGFGRHTVLPANPHQSKGNYT